jgi:ATP adenylyltransferase
VALERFSAAWRESYVSSDDARKNARDETKCVFCELANLEADASSGVVKRSSLSYVALNAFPYGSGHVLVLPRRHVAHLSELRDDEYEDFMQLLRTTTAALDRAYGADGMNIGFNLGRAGGAGIPKHLHGHLLPRWEGDTNFMTSIGETRVLPESLESTWQKVHDQF